MTGIERLRELARTFHGGPVNDACGYALKSIADQIERERDKVAQTDWQTVRDVASDMASRVFMSATIDGLLRDWSRKLTDATDGHCHAADVSMSAYDLLPEDEREAVAWVREHGGVEHVRQQWAYLSGRANHADHVDRQLAKRQRQIDESHAALRRKNACIAELESTIDVRERANEQLNDELNAMRPRLMPEGCFWPHFEGGEPVKLGEEAMGFTHKPPFVVDHITIFAGGEATVCAEADPVSGKVENFVRTLPGERVKRPAPKVLDADGAEIELGDDLYSVEGSLKFHVSHIDRINGKVATDAMFALDRWADPSLLTHRAPVLAADGRPLREGETVWDTKGNGPYIIDGLEGDGVVRIKGNDFDYFGSEFVHERPDSYDALWEDIEACAVGYEGFMRRVKALAGRDA